MKYKEKIKAEIERLKRWNDNVRESTRHMTFQEEVYNRAKNSSYLELLEFVNSLPEEPVSKDLEKAAKDWLIPQLDKYYTKYGETKMMELTRFDGYAMLDAIEFGAQWQKEQDRPVSKDLEIAIDNSMPKPYFHIEDGDDYYGEEAYNNKQMANMFKAGAQWQEDRIKEALLSEVLPHFMHGGEADEVIAKLEEVL